MTESTPAERPTIRVLMVCLGNICRSPMAEGVFRNHVARAGLADRIDVASAGTGKWHIGEAPHPGTVRELARHGIGIDGKRAQHVSAAPRQAFDYVVAMDRSNMRDLGGDAVLLLDFADPPSPVSEVPDPYYDDNFGEVYELVDAGCLGLLAFIAARHGLTERPG
jgi:protein-tyrosine phosphatase